MTACSLDALDPGAAPDGSFGARLWENVWDEAADALCFPARLLGCG